MATTRQTWWFRTGATGLMAAAGAGFLAGRTTSWNQVSAAPPAKPATPPAAETNSRFVAHLYNGTVPITREDLGEYLIARHGKDCIDLLVNKTIIDHACSQKGITVTDAEVEAALLEDLKGINVNRKQFVDNVLKQYGKTLYEWKEDVLRPRLQLTKLCKLQISVTEDEIKQAFDSEFGPRVEGRIIIWPKGQEKFAYDMYDAIRSSDDKFDEAARQQTNSHLGASGGRIKPFGRGAGTNDLLEAEAFKLKPGQVSTVIGTKEGTVVFKCDRQLPPDENAKLDNERERLSRMVYEKKLAQEIPKQFKILRDAANPVVFIKKEQSAEDVERTTQQLLQTGGTQPKK